MYHIFTDGMAMTTHTFETFKLGTLGKANTILTEK